MCINSRQYVPIQVLRIAQWVLLIIKNDVPSLNDGTLTWWVVFIPVYLLGGAIVLRTTLRCIRARKKKMQKQQDARASAELGGFVPGVEGDAMYRDATAEDGQVTIVCVHVCVSFCVFLCA
jgi:hypothetical protein